MFTTERFKPNSLCTSLHAIIIQGLSLNNCPSTDFLASPHEEGLRKEKAHHFVVLWEICISMCIMTLLPGYDQEPYKEVKQ